MHRPGKATNRLLIVLLSAAFLPIAVTARATNDPVPDSSISARVAQTADFAVCGSCVDPWKEPRTSEPEDRATGRPAGIATLFIHARHHFLSLEFTRNGAKQAAVFEIGKAMPLTLLPVLEAKTGKKVEYQSKKE